MHAGQGCLFGDVVDGAMLVNDAGVTVKQCWHDIPTHFPQVELDEFVVMPNHVHGIVVICRDNCRGEVSSAIAVSPIPEIKQGGGTTEGVDTPPLQRCTLGKIVAYFEYQSAKQINQIRKTPGHYVWQRNYYEHSIRSEEEINRIREYIIGNPAKWSEDEDNPGNITIRRGKKFFAPADANIP